MQPNDVVLTFLRSVGRPAEVEYYLGLFRSQARESFAILSVDARVEREALDVDLHFLAALDLYPHVAAPGDDLLALVTERRARKLVFLGPWRGLEPSDRPVPSLVDVRREYDELCAVLPDEHRALLVEARRLIDGAPHKLTVAVTSPMHLLRELFTVRGAGTLIRRSVPIERHADHATVDRARLHAVIESAFGRAPSAASFARPVAGIYVAADYAGAAVVEPSPLGAYLSKFAVDRGAQGEGIGRDLWRAIVADHPALFWRARAQNPILGWYTEQCEGMHRAPEWHVFWRGLSPDRIPAAIAAALAGPDDFADGQAS